MTALFVQIANASDAKLVFTTIVNDLKTNSQLQFGNIEQYMGNDRCIVRLVATGHTFRHPLDGDPTSFIMPVFPSFSQIASNDATILKGTDQKNREVWIYVGLENLSQFEARNSLRLEAACWVKQ